MLFGEISQQEFSEAKKMWKRVTKVFDAAAIKFDVKSLLFVSDVLFSHT